MKYYQPELLKPEIFKGDSISGWFSVKGKEVHHSASIEGLNLGFNTDEAPEIVKKNRFILADTIGTELTDIAFAKQVHGVDIAEIHKGGIYENVDGFFTTQKGIALAIQVADCAAVLLGDSVAEAIMAVHAGWRGAVAGIVPKAIEKMISKGSKLGNICVFISPCISQQNFEVGMEVAKQFPSQFVDRDSYPKPHVDLRGFIIHQLTNTGILQENIEADESCTFSDENLYSYRKDGRQSGRMVGIIKLNHL